MAKRNEIAKTILLGLGAVGFIATAIIAPGAAAVIAKELKLGGKFSNGQIRKSLLRLEKSKLIGVGKDGDKTVVHLTKGGKEKLLKYKLEEMKIQPQKRWDKMWRLVIFDVPEDFHLNRTIFSRKLRDMGLRLLQKSVWVCPYPCEDEIEFLKTVYNIRSYVRVVTAIKIDIQNDLVKEFKLF